MTPTKSVGPSVIIQLRRRYQLIWGREWPHDNNYLKVLWLECRQSAGIGTARGRTLPPELWTDCLERMREDHEFDSHQLPEGLS